VVQQDLFTWCLCVPGWRESEYPLALNVSLNILTQLRHIINFQLFVNESRKFHMYNHQNNILDSTIIIIEYCILTM